MGLGSSVYLQSKGGNIRGMRNAARGGIPSGRVRGREGGVRLIRGGGFVDLLWGNLDGNRGGQKKAFIERGGSLGN